jgi:hypothetical protein
LDGAEPDPRRGHDCRADLAWAGGGSPWLEVKNGLRANHRIHLTESEFRSIVRWSRAKRRLARRKTTASRLWRPPRAPEATPPPRTSERASLWRTQRLLFRRRRPLGSIAKREGPS